MVIGRNKKASSAPMPESAGPSGEEAADTVLALVLEMHRLSSLMMTVLGHLGPLDQKKYSSRLAFIGQKIQSIVEGAQLRIVALEGTRFDEGMAVTAINLSDFGSEEELYIDKVVEPLVMSPHGVAHRGIVSVKRREQ